MSMTNQSILITGANGYIGARLSVLLSKNNLVTALCHNMYQMKISFSNTIHKIIAINANTQRKAVINQLL